VPWNILSFAEQEGYSHSDIVRKGGQGSPRAVASGGWMDGWMDIVRRELIGWE
jgi:hypothetical protein